MRRARIVIGMFAVLSIAFATSNAQAGGLEYNGAGTRAAGRGGAFAARADDPMALQLNPALLADLGGTQLMLNANVALYNACVTRPGAYIGDSDPRTVYSFAGGSADWIGKAFPEVCNETPFAPGASLVATFHLADGLTLGAGVLTPYAAGAIRFGALDGTVANGTLPSPVRYNLIQQNLLQVFPSVGVGYRVNPWLAVGATFQWGLTHISYTNNAATQPGTDPLQDLRADITVADYFTPAVIGSVALRPTPSLDFMLGFRWVDNVKARGDVAITALVFDDPATVNSVTTLHDVRLVAPQTGALSFGARYGHRRHSGAPITDAAQESLRGETYDRMNTELFDVEFDAVYELNNRVNDFVVTLPENPKAEIPGVGLSPLPSPIHLGHKWQNQLSLRLGGDFNVLPGTLAVRAGVSYETSGVDNRFAQLDFIPGERIGVGGGATLRLGKLDLSLAYQHIFQADITSTATDTEGLRQIALGAGEVINQGTYSARFDVFSLGATYRF